MYRHLGDNHTGKNQGAAGKLRGGHGIVQNQPAAQSGKHRFQAHNQRGGSGFQPLLTDNLHTVANTHGQHTCKAQRQPAVKDGL